jgi:hypothetical protein
VWGSLGGEILCMPAMPVGRAWRAKRILRVCVCARAVIIMLAESQDSACRHVSDCISPMRPNDGPHSSPQTCPESTMSCRNCPPRKSAHGLEGARLCHACAHASSPCSVSGSHDPRAGACAAQWRRPRGGIHACNPPSSAGQPGRGGRQSDMAAGGGEP